jgi:arylsulfatase A-like enzyme
MDCLALIASFPQPSCMIARRFFLTSIVLTGLFCLLNLPLEAAPSKPNVVIIFSDDQGMHDVGCYGSEIPTPNIDSLAKDGMKLDQFYAASAICTPSRFGLLTGRNPSRSQDRLLSALMFLAPEHKERGLKNHERTIASVLQESSYETALIGKWHLGHGHKSFFPHHHGFDFAYGHTAGCVDFFTMSYGNTPDWYRNGELLDVTGYATDDITDEAVRYIEDRSREKPFFLFLPYNAPHFGKGWDDGKDVPINILQPHPRDLERVSFIKDPTRRKFAAMVAALDDGVGRVLKALDDAGLRENTMVIFMTDHGGDPNYGGDNQPYRDGKATLFEGGIRVPCLVRWPGVVAPGSKSSEVTWAIDWFPTLAKLAGANVDDLPLDGMDLLPVLQGKSSKDSRELFWELGAHAELERGQWLGLRHGDWKYVLSPVDGEWLFDLGTDPYEQFNLAPQNKQQFVKMQQRAKILSKRYHPSN